MKCRGIDCASNKKKKKKKKSLPEDFSRARHWHCPRTGSGVGLLCTEVDRVGLRVTLPQRPRPHFGRPSWFVRRCTTPPSPPAQLCCQCRVTLLLLSTTAATRDDMGDMLVSGTPAMATNQPPTHARHEEPPSRPPNQRVGRTAPAGDALHAGTATITSTRTRRRHGNMYFLPTTCTWLAWTPDTCYLLHVHGWHGRACQLPRLYGG